MVPRAVEQRGIGLRDEEVVLGRRIGQWVMGAGMVAAVGWVVAVAITGPRAPAHLVEEKKESVAAPDPTLEGYEYGVWGNRVGSAAVVSGLAVEPDGQGGETVRITVWRGPSYDDVDPDANGYPGCTLLGALAAGYFEDMDAAQVVVCWKDKDGKMDAGDNLVDGPVLGRVRAARWEWSEPLRRDVVCTKVEIGKEAVELTVLLVYTDVLWGYADMYTPPEDGPAVMGSWDGVKVDGTWRLRGREEVGVGAVPGMDSIEQAEAAGLVKGMIEERTAGRYTLVVRNNMGLENPRKPGLLIGYDSGFDIVRVEKGGDKGE
jgi:hypothetical protein